MNTSWRVRGTCASNEYDDLLVCMEGRHILWASVNLISVKEGGGWDLMNLPTKSHALLLYRMRQRVMK